MLKMIFDFIYFKIIDKIHTLWYNIKYGIENLIRWFPVIWKDRNWDYYYFFKILEKKLGLLEETHTDGIYIGWQPVAKKLKIAKNLCKRLAEENYKSEYMQKQDIDLLCNIINKEVFKWWD